jgi:hypothetical protein
VILKELTGEEEVAFVDRTAEGDLVEEHRIVFVLLSENTVVKVEVHVAAVEEE